MRLSWGSRKEVLSVHTPLFIREEIELKLPRGGTLPLILMSRVMMPWGGGHRGPNNFAGITFKKEMVKLTIINPITTNASV